MRKKDIFIGILAGGKGERLWPKSRADFPKQNLRLFGRRTILQNTFGRARKIGSGGIFIITNKENASSVARQLKNFKGKNIVAEPYGRNTAPAIGLAALLAFRKNKDSVLVAMPSDHFIGDNKRFLRIINTAIEEAEKTASIITLGIKPNSADSAYGYIGIKEGSSHISPKGSYRVTKFIEKPNPIKAKRLVSSGRFFWNSGIFIFKTSALLSMLKRHMPVLYGGLKMLPNIKNKTLFKKKMKNLYGRLESKSLDYALLEKGRNMRVIPSDFGWSDIGSFNSIAALAKRDKDGNVVSGRHVGIDTKESIIFSNPDCLVGTIGIKGLIVVATPDAVLVCRRESGQDIRKLVEKIKKDKRLLKFL